MNANSDFFVNFFTRYTAGENALRYDRSISLKRIALNKALPHYDDIQCKQHLEQQKKYLSAFQRLSSTEVITEKLLIKINSSIQKSKSKGYRKKTGYIGKSYREAVYIAPEPAKIDRLMKQLLERLNQDSHCSVYKALYAHAMINFIHPFGDGNGRVARLLYDTISYSNNVRALNPILFRLCFSSSIYKDFLNGVESENWEQSDAYLMVKKWCSLQYSNIEKIYEQHKSLALESATIPLLGLNINPIIEELIKNPILSHEQLETLVDKITTDKKSMISFLVDSKMITPRRVSSSLDDIVYVCQNFMDMQKSIELALFETPSNI